MKVDIDTAKQYMRVDYDDDDALITLMLNAVLDDLGEKISDFDRDHVTNRQQLLILATIKDLYDNRDKYVASPGTMQTTISSISISEML